MNDDQLDYIAQALDAAAKLGLLWAVARPLFGESEASAPTIALGGAFAAVRDWRERQARPRD